MNPTQLSEPVRLNRENQALEFVRLSPQAVIALREKFRIYRKRQLVESLALSGIAGLEGLKVLNQFDARKIPQSALIEWINTIEGQYEAIMQSFRQPDMTDDQAVEKFNTLRLTEDEMLTVAAGVMNLELTTAHPPDSVVSTSTPNEIGDANVPSSVTTADLPATP